MPPSCWAHCKTIRHLVSNCEVIFSSSDNVIKAHAHQGKKNAKENGVELNVVVVEPILTKPSSSSLLEDVIDATQNVTRDTEHP